MQSRRRPERAGAEGVLAYASHAVFSGEAVSRIASSEIDQVVVTDTIPLSEAAKNCDRIRQVTIAGLLPKPSAALAMKNPSHIFSMKK